jgi:AcrR family transcriptional regulator
VPQHQPALRKEDARITKSRDALCAALLTLIENRPYDPITIREITDQAGVGYATFYRHFPTKSALLDHVAAAQIRALVELALPVLASRNSAAACLAIFHYVEAHRAIWQSLLNGGAGSTVRDEIIEIARELAATQPNLGDRSGPLPHNLAFRFAASGMVEVLAWWLAEEAISAAQGAQFLDTLVIAPLMASGD